MSGPEFTGEDIEQMSKKKLRKEFPSGWMKLTRYETNVILVDTLLQEPADREFTASELEDLSGVSERSIKDRINDLVELGIIIELPDRDQTRYQIDNQSPIVRKLHELNSTIQRVRNGGLEKSVRDLSLTRQKDPDESGSGLEKGKPSPGSIKPKDSYAH